MPALPARVACMTLFLGGGVTRRVARRGPSSGGGMLRVAAWTGGLFGAGAAISQLFPTAWTEPVVLLALGATLLAVSARGPGRSRRARALSPKQAAA
jgi:predicted acyltransferase